MTLDSMTQDCLHGFRLPSSETDETPAEVEEYARSQTIKKGSSTRFCSSMRRIMTRTYTFFMMSVVVAIMVASLIQPIYANPTCILNCAQCVKIYGEFFDGHTCAKVCMESRTKFESFVDCADPTTIARFLKTY